MQSYLTNRQQRTKVNSRYSSWAKVPFGVPQCSILALLLFNIHTCDMFLWLKSMILAATQVITLTIWDGTIKNLMLNLEKLSKNTFQWFYLNQVKGNHDKYHLILSNGKKVRMNFKI